MLYVGTGISGGEIGALTGPSVMPGGSPAAWPLVKDLLQGIAAKLDDGTPCCEWIGSGGAGHYVKMVHNGIEYGDMQLIAESYFMLRKYGQLENDEIADIFAGWNKGELNSYLIGITADICRVRDTDGGYLLDRILDIAGQKGTGKWTPKLLLRKATVDFDHRGGTCPFPLGHGRPNARRRRLCIEVKIMIFMNMPVYRIYCDTPYMLRN